MKILYSHFGIYKKGGWGRTFPLAKGLVKLGNEVTILTTSPKRSIFTKTFLTDDVKIVIVPDIIGNKFTSKGYGLLSLVHKILYAAFHKFDIVHSDVGHRPLSGIPCRINKGLYKTPYIAEWWDLFGAGGQFDKKNKLYKFFFGRYELKWEIQDKVKADGIVVLSEYLRKKAQNLKENDSIIKIHGGADLDYIKFVYDNSEIKKTIGISNEFLTFGYLDAYDKSLSELNSFIETFIELKDTLKLKLIVFGMKLDDKIKKKLGNGLINFEWIDFSKDATKFACVDIFLMLKEDNIVNIAGWPNKIGEYMACGRPILLNPVGEMIEFVKLHPDAMFITENNQQAIRRIIIRIYKQKDNLLNLGKINRDISEQEMSWDIKSKKLFSFYKTIYESTHPATKIR